MSHIILFDLSLNENHKTGNTFGDVMALSLRLNSKVQIQGVDKEGNFLSLTSPHREGFFIPNITKKAIQEALFSNESATLIEIDGAKLKKINVLTGIIEPNASTNIKYSNKTSYDKITGTTPEAYPAAAAG